MMKHLYTVTSIATGKKFSTVLCSDCAETSVVSTSPTPVEDSRVCRCGK